MKNTGRFWLLFAGVMFLLESSCATMHPIPETEYKTADPTWNKTYRLTTKDKRVYEFKEFAVTDSTLVILKVVLYRAKPHEMSAIKGSVDTPIVIPWDYVKSLEQAERSNLLTAFGITTGVIVVGGLALAVLVAWAFAEGMSGLN